MKYQSNRREGQITIDFRNCSANSTSREMKQAPVFLTYVEYPPKIRSLVFLAQGDSSLRPVYYTKIKSFDFGYVQFWRTRNQIVWTSSVEPLMFPYIDHNTKHGLNEIHLPNSSACYICLGDEYMYANFENRIKAFWHARFDYEIDEIRPQPLTLDRLAYSITSAGIAYDNL